MVGTAADAGPGGTMAQPEIRGDGSDPAPRVTRRQLLVRSGVLAVAAASAPALLRPRPARAGLLGGLLGTDPGLLDAARGILAEISIDTYRGLVVFVAPGNDPYSQHQGAATPRPGAIAAGADRFVSAALDEFIPIPDAAIRPTLRTLGDSLDEAGVQVPTSLLGGLLGGLTGSQLALLDQVGEAIDELLENDETLPLSALIAMVLNLEATAVDPTTVAGAFTSPFARLSAAEKARVFANLEDARPDLVALLDANFPEPLRQSVSGVLRFTAGALLEFSAFATFSEHGTFDPATRRLTARPVGWDLSSYALGFTNPPEGWDEFLGYYQNRRSVR